jgi:phosphopantothenoylcysteine decarboxylase/phosphopantothenate--cysteine ligase
MLRAVRKALSPGAVLAMAAAPADFRPARVSAHKIKKEACGKRITLTLERTADILATLRKSGPRPAYTVMFSAETRDLMRNSLKKMKAKDADLLVANDVGLKDSGFGSDDNRAVLVTRAGKVLTTGKISKDALADIIMDAVEAGLR